MNQMQATVQKMQQNATIRDQQQMMETRGSNMSASGRKMAVPYNAQSPYSPAARMMLDGTQSVGTVGTSATLINVGNTVMGNTDMSQSKLNMQHQRIVAAAQEQIKNLGPHNPMNMT